MTTTNAHPSLVSAMCQRLARLLPGLLALALALVLMWPTAPARAQNEADAVQVAGQAFARRVKLAGQDLLLNGTGVRAVAWFKGYAAGLYLQQPARSAKDVQAAPGPKRLQMRMLADVQADEFVKALRKGVARNTPDAEMPAIELQLEKLAADIQRLGKVRKGDVVDLDHDPAKGMSLVVNGQTQGPPLPGSALYAALLRSFVGDKPYDKDLRQGLLGLSS